MGETTGSSRSQGFKWSLWSIFVVLFGIYVLFTVFGKTLSWIIIVSGALYFLRAIDFVQNLINRLREEDEDEEWDLCCLLNGCILRRACACAHSQSKHAKFIKAQKKAKGSKSEEHEKQSAKGISDVSELSPAKGPTEIEMKEIKKQNPIPDGAPIAWKTDMNDTQSEDKVCDYMTCLAFEPGYWRCGFENGREAGVHVDDWCSKSGQVPDYIPTRVGYYRDGHRYPHRNVHPNDEVGQKHLQELKEHWRKKCATITHTTDECETPKEKETK